MLDPRTIRTDVACHHQRQAAVYSDLARYCAARAALCTIYAAAYAADAVEHQLKAADHYARARLTLNITE